jgi:hypothetical protein
MLYKQVTMTNLSGNFLKKRQYVQLGRIILQPDRSVGDGASVAVLPFAARQVNVPGYASLNDNGRHQDVFAEQEFFGKRRTNLINFNLNDKSLAILTVRYALCHRVCRVDPPDWWIHRVSTRDGQLEARHDFIRILVVQIHKLA